MATSKQTAAEKTASQRLNEIWREWSVTPDAATSKAQVEALGHLEEWLRGGVSAPERVVRAVQCLLADPEQPGAAKRPAVKAVIEPLIEVWPNAGTGANDLVFLQAMLLAAWPYGMHEGGFALAPLFEGAWEVVRGREPYRKRIEAWRDAISLAGQTPAIGGVKVDWGPSELQLEFTGFDLSSAKGPQGLEYLTKNAAQGWNYSSFANQLSFVLTDHQNALEAVQNFCVGLGARLQTTLSQQNQLLMSVLAKNLEASHSEIEILWWGQAQYCHLRRRPYRRIKDPDEAAWWAACEVAHRAELLSVEPVAAYLVQVLSVQGRDIEETLPLGQWIERLHRTLGQSKSGGDEVTPVGSEIANLADEDALGLPVTWVRRKAETGKEIQPSPAVEATGLSLDAPIDRGQWASWILRELLLELKLRQFTKPKKKPVEAK